MAIIVSGNPSERQKSPPNDLWLYEELKRGGIESVLMKSDIDIELALEVLSGK